MEETKEVIKEHYSIKFNWKKDETIHRVNFKIVRVVNSYDFKGEAMNFSFFCYDTGNGISPEKCTFEEAFELDSLCSGFIKWDGCMEIHDLTHHFCGYTTILQDIVKDIYKEAANIMGDAFDKDLADFNKIEDGRN